MFWAALSLLRFQAMQFLTDLKKAAKGQREDEAAPQPVVDDAPCGWWSVDVRMITGDELSVRAKKTSGLKIGISCHWKYHRILCYFWDGVLWSSAKASCQNPLDKYSTAECRGRSNCSPWIHHWSSQGLYWVDVGKVFLDVLLILVNMLNAYNKINVLLIYLPRCYNNLNHMQANGVRVFILSETNVVLWLNGIDCEDSTCCARKWSTSHSISMR